MSLLLFYFIQYKVLVNIIFLEYYLQCKLKYLFLLFYIWVIPTKSENRKVCWIESLRNWFSSQCRVQILYHSFTGVFFLLFHSHACELALIFLRDYCKIDNFALKPTIFIVIYIWIFKAISNLINFRFLTKYMKGLFLALFDQFYTWVVPNEYGQFVNWFSITLIEKKTQPVWLIKLI